ncbi:glycine cleavage system protein GcvH [Thermithiobacillus plumbiphilus]|uniref:Glycine cleavage system H protein n=1 Tax=Thermithiobacillus plumbiphilus TaxID=1729899 RepID=A0ABU9D691_9PROT
MSNIPNDRRYTETHEWVQPMGEGVFRVGISDHAQDLLGDLVYVEAPQVGKQLNAKQDAAVVESVKAASDVYAPIAGEITAGNEALAGAPETINQDAYGEGWIFEIKASNPADYDNLLDAGAYQNLIESE